MNDDRRHGQRAGIADGGDRIAYGDDGVLDELVICDAQVVHMERLAADAINLSVTDSAGTTRQFAILGRKLHITPFLED